jgi:nicotinamidase-related amidase
MAGRSRELLDRRLSRVVVIDLQERLVPVIAGRNELLADTRLLIEGARVWGVPVTLTEQYPQGLGGTVPEIRGLVDDTPREKLRMSAADCLAWGPSSQAERSQVVVAGIETHVCVQQTALDLLALGYQLFIAVDAVGARHPRDHDVALARLASSGATLTTVESILFEWAEQSGSPAFKQTSALVKARSAQR